MASFVAPIFIFLGAVSLTASVAPGLLDRARISQVMSNPETGRLSRRGAVIIFVLIGAGLALHIVVLVAAESATRGEPIAMRVEQGLVALAFAAFLALAMIPIVTITARIEGGDMIVSGSRWPGPTRIWSMTPREAATFEIHVADDDKRHVYRSIALRTSDGRVLPLTASAYRGGTRAHEKPLALLNAWLVAASR